MTYYASESVFSFWTGTPDVLAATMAAAYKAMVSMPFAWAALARWMRRKTWGGHVSSLVHRRVFADFLDEGGGGVVFKLTTLSKLASLARCSCVRLGWARS